MAMTHEEAQALLRSDDHVYQIAREVWMKAEREALAEQRGVLAAKHSAQLGYEVVCGCGQKHLVVLTLAISGRLEGGEDHARIVRIEPVQGEDAGLGGEGKDGQAGLQPQDAVFHVVHSSLHRVGCTADGRGRAGVGEGDNSPRPRETLQAAYIPRQKPMKRGDGVVETALGVISLFVLLYVFLVAPIMAGWQ